MARRSLFDDEESAEINLSPMIDCIFILLIFFIVTTVFVEEQGLTVNKPDASAATTTEESETVTIDITAGDEILFDDREISLSDVTRRVRNVVATGEERPVMVRAHERSSHGAFVAVWDAARRGGAEKLGFTTVN
jgi:biopolymer transport protein ExbD